MHTLLVNMNKTKQTGKKELVKKSDRHPAHISRLLSDDKLVLYEKKPEGFVPRGKLNASMHRWILEDDGDDEPATTTLEGVTYNVSVRKIIKTIYQALIDRGANGCVFGSDCVLLGEPTNARFVAITGLDNHQMPNVPIRNVGSLCHSNRGPVICIWNDVAYTGQHQSIISATQMEAFNIRVDDRSIKAGGYQRIMTPEGYNFALSIKQGLPYLEMRAYTTDEYHTYPHVIMTSDKIWNPNIFDNDVDTTDPSVIANSRNNLHMLPHPDYDLEGEYIRAHGTEHQSSSPSNDLGFGTDDDPTETMLKNEEDDFNDFVGNDLFEDAVQYEEDMEELEETEDREDTEEEANGGKQRQEQEQGRQEREEEGRYRRQ
jgi:hypothetical protein